jgi:hypothetical protein
VRTARFARENPRTIEEKQQVALRQDARRERLHVRGVGHLPVDPDQARYELSLEERARRGSRPSSRRWRQLDKLDSEIDRLTLRQTEATRQLQETEQTLASAPADDARTLADWLAAGEKGERPAATIYERTRNRDATHVLVEAASIELDRKLAERAEFIAKNRPKMLADARQDAEQASRRLQEAVSALPALREHLLEARENIVWVASFPDPPESFGHPHNVALGLAEPVRRALHTSALVPYERLVALLIEDADTLTGRFSTDQMRRLGEPVEATPATEAMWSDDPRSRAWAAQELERAQRIAEYHLNPHEVAVEARDYRPDP